MSSPFSARFIKTVRAFCHGMDPEGILDLGRSANSGGLPSFVTELRDAITTRTLTPETWADLTQTSLDPDDWELLDDDLREVWAAVAPNQPYPRLPGSTANDQSR